MKRSVLCATLLFLAACEHSTQATSGAEYLARHPVVAGTAVAGEGGFEQALREAASVEPLLRFPARIGLARIDAGQLSNIPPEEANAWVKLREHLGSGFGELIPLSPMITQMATQAAHGLTEQERVDTINQIRLGAARQHLDAVLIYEPYGKGGVSDNMLVIANLTIIGGFILPSRHLEAEGFAQAVLIDVMQAYPYGTVSAQSDKQTTIASHWGWGYKTQELVDESKTKAVYALAEQVEKMMRQLRTKLEKQPLNQ